MSMKRPNCLKCPTWQNKILKDTHLCLSPPSTNQTNQFVISWPKFLNLPHEIRCFIWWVPLIITCGIRSLVESDALIVNTELCTKMISKTSHHSSISEKGLIFHGVIPGNSFLHNWKKIAICSPNCVQIWKSRDRKMVFCRVRHKKCRAKAKARLFYVKPCNKTFLYENKILRTHNFFCWNFLKARGLENSCLLH